MRYPSYGMKSCILCENDFRKGLCDEDTKKGVLRCLHCKKVKKNQCVRLTPLLIRCKALERS